MSEDESEFIVVDESPSLEIKETISMLIEVIEMYKGSHDALTKSNILLQDQLHLALQLVLQRVPPDLDLNKEKILSLVSESAMSTCSDSVRREYVTKLCSKLVAVNNNYEKLVKDFEEFKLSNPNLSSIESKLDRLTEVLRSVESVLPATQNSNSESLYDRIFPQALNSTEDKLNSLCALAELINLRFRTSLDSLCLRSTLSSADSDASCLPIPDVSTTDLKGETLDKQCETSSDLIEKIVSEKVNELLKNENLISQQVNKVEPSPGTFNCQEMKDLVTPTSSCPLLSLTSSELPTTTLADLEYPAITCWAPTDQETLPISAQSYTTDQERPECPVCNVICPDRSALETHLDVCLS